MLSKHILKVSSLARGSRVMRVGLRGACNKSCSAAGFGKGPFNTSCGQQCQKNPIAQFRPQTTVAAQQHSEISITSAHADDAKEMVEVQWADGSEAQFPYLWLRDCCQCPKCWHPTTRSRLLRMEQLDPNVKPIQLQFTDSTVSINWSDDHESVYDASWLEERQFNDKWTAKRLKRNWIKPKYFGSEMQEDIPSITYDDFMNNDHALYEWLCSMEATGLHLIKGAMDDGSLPKIASRVAYLRNHNYGEQFHVMSKPDPNNLAFTNATLGLHTDNPYYYYVPGVQMLHCIEQTGTKGGDNVFADGFNAADQLRKEDPETFEILTQLPVDFYDVGREVDYDYFLRTRKPTVNIDRYGEIYQINYNNQVRDTELNLPLEDVTRYYRALKAFDNLLYHPRNAVYYKLKKGEVVCFHNYRVLHGRLGYQMTEGGHRHLNGGFLDWDEMHSRRRVLQVQLGL